MWLVCAAMAAMCIQGCGSDPVSEVQDKVVFPRCYHDGPLCQGCSGVPGDECGECAAGSECLEMWDCDAANSPAPQECWTEKRCVDSTCGLPHPNPSSHTCSYTVTGIRCDLHVPRSDKDAPPQCPDGYECLQVYRCGPDQAGRLTCSSGWCGSVAACEPK
jgi:hypothetical protein